MANFVASAPVRIRSVQTSGTYICSQATRATMIVIIIRCVVGDDDFHCAAVSLGATRDDIEIRFTAHAISQYHLRAAAAKRILLRYSGENYGSLSFGRSSLTTFPKSKAAFDEKQNMLA